jgi:integrase
MLNRLSARSIEAKLRRGRYADGGGLVLQVSKWGTKSWIFRYVRHGRERHMGLGPLSALPLAKARDRAQKCRELLLADRDPIEVRESERQQRRAEAARGVSFRWCAESYIAAHRSSWRNTKHRAQWSATLATYVYPHIGDLVVSTVDTTLVLKCLEPVWSTKPETAGRMRGRIEAILDWAKVRGYRDGENPARWRGHLNKLLPTSSRNRRVRHHPALPYNALPDFLVSLRAQDGIAARALEFTILTAARTNETIGAVPSEVAARERIWTVPPERMKSNKEHRVPLAPAAISALEGVGPLQATNRTFLFPGRSPDKPLSNMAMTQTLRRMGRADITVHGFRSTFRDWASEQTNYPNEVIEMALAHVIGNKVEAAYRRGDLFEKRRRLMNEWARYCGQSTRAASGNTAVVLLRA